VRNPATKLRRAQGIFGKQCRVASAEEDGPAQRIAAARRQDLHRAVALTKEGGERLRLAQIVRGE
jgi:hypothetical protein